MGARVDFNLPLNACLSPQLYDAYKLAHICQIEVLLNYLT